MSSALRAKGVALLLRAAGALLVVFEEGFAVVRLQPIGPPHGFHLNDAEIDAQLQLLLAIAAEDLAHLELARLIRPVAQQIIQIETHVRGSIEMRRSPCQ